MFFPRHRPDAVCQRRRVHNDNVQGTTAAIGGTHHSAARWSTSGGR